MTQYPNFKGLYVFNGGNGSQLKDNPSIAGTYLGFYWAQIEKSPGIFDWSIVETAMAPWVASGKKAIVRLSTCAWKKWQPQQDSGHATPQWVYDQGVGHIVEDDGAVKPQYWHPHFLDNFAFFVATFAAKYDGDPRIAAIEIGVGDGGETKPDTRNNPNRLSLWKKIGYTDKIWWETIQTIILMYKKSFVKSQLVIMPDATFIGGTTGYNMAMVTDYAIKEGIGLQNNGIITGQKPIPQSWHGVMIISEQRLPTSQSHESLDSDIKMALDEGSTYMLCFLEDLANPKNASLLAKYAAMVKA